MWLHTLTARRNKNNKNNNSGKNNSSGFSTIITPPPRQAPHWDQSPAPIRIRVTEWHAGITTAPKHRPPYQPSHPFSSDSLRDAQVCAYMVI